MWAIRANLCGQTVLLQNLGFQAPALNWWYHIESFSLINRALNLATPCKHLDIISSWPCYREDNDMQLGGHIKVVLKAKWSCSVVGLLQRERQTKLLKFQPNRTYGFWDIAVERFFVFYCFCQYIDKVNDYFYLIEFWSETVPMCSYSLKH